MEVKMEVKRYAQDMCIVNLYRPLLLPLLLPVLLPFSTSESLVFNF